MLCSGFEPSLFNSEHSTINIYSATSCYTQWQLNSLLTSLSVELIVIIQSE